MSPDRTSETGRKLTALAFSVALIVTVPTGAGTPGHVVGASTVGNVTISDPDDGPMPGAGNVPVAGIEFRSDDTIINDHDGTTDARTGDPVGSFGGTAYYYDSDGSGDYTPGDELVLDSDGDATYTARTDTLVAGQSAAGLPVTTADGFDADWALDSYDADATDGRWDDGQDAIVIESGSGGTYSTGADTVLNAGSSGDVDATVDATLRPMGDISGTAGGPHLVDSNGNGEFDAGEDTVTDDDEDDQYTVQADAKIDGNGGSGTQDSALATFDAPAGASMTGAEAVSIPVSGTPPPNGNALYYVDSDGSGDYTTSDEVILDPNIGSAASLTYDADGASDEDADGVAGDDVLLFVGDDLADNANEGDTLERFTASDHVAFEDAGYDGTDDGEYQEGEEIYVDYNDGGTVSTGADGLVNAGASGDSSAGDPLVALDGLSSPSGLRWYDEDGNDGYDDGDEIAVDEDGDGVYTGSADTLVAGTAPSTGTSLSTGQDDDWTIDAHDASDGGSWDDTADALFIDANDGGTFSATTDTRINAGEDGTFDVSDGDPLSDLDESTYGYVDTDGNGLDSGDEVYEERDASSPSAATVYGDEVTELRVEQIGTLDTQYIDSVDLYRDDGDGTLDPATDTLVQADATRTGSTYTFSGLSQSLDTSRTAYFVAIDLTDDTPSGETLEFQVPGGGIVFAQDAATGGQRWTAIDIETSSDTDDAGDDPDPDSDPEPEPNEPPDATADTYTVVTNATLSMPVANGVLATDSDPDDARDGLTATVESDPATGTLALARNGSFTYTPGNGFTGVDSFTYAVSDGDGGEDTAAVTIDVTPPPIELSDPEVLETESVLGQRSSGSGNATLTAAERMLIPVTMVGPTRVRFTENTSLESVLFHSDTSGTLTVVEYATPTAAYSDVPGSVLVAFRISGSAVMENTTATVRTRVSREEIRAADVTASSARIAHRTDGTWKLLNTTVASRGEEAVLLAATTDGASPFAVTALRQPNASIAVTPTPATVGEELTLDAGPTTTPDGAIVSYEWSVAGQSRTGETATVTFETPGEYTVELMVTNDVGRTATTATTVVVDNETEAGTPPDVRTSQTPDDPEQTGTKTPAVSDTATEKETTAGDGSGFGIIVALVALAGGALLVSRRRR